MSVVRGCAAVVAFGCAGLVVFFGSMVTTDTETVSGLLDNGAPMTVGALVFAVLLAVGGTVLGCDRRTRGGRSRPCSPASSCCGCGRSPRCCTAGRTTAWGGTTTVPTRA
ncbi:hypothetical protein ACWEWI_03645 [Streptomyces sp. NPDC003753]|uniref:hypothetical protein n=1 Tax=unclassified Streptomyces TaxID=2593676 RepID=UPI001904E5F6|nr:hypothetical protein [Streptomyces sp. Y2F8-2]